MFKRRGILIQVSILLLLLIPFLGGRTEGEATSILSKLFLINSPGNAWVDENGLQYVLALEIRGGDDDESGCDNYASNYIGLWVHPQKVAGSKLYYKGPADCKWKDLPLNKEGCYFTTREYDYDGDGGGTPPDDCAGWVIPADEKSVITAEESISNAHNHFFKDDNTGITTQGFVKQLGEPYDYIENGNVDTDYTPTGAHSICVFRGQHFSSPYTFRCIPSEGEHRWYICDEENLFEKTGKYIPVPSCLKSNNNDETAEEGECLVDYPTCNDAGLCVNQQGEVRSETEKKGWICTKDDTQLVWKQKTLTCQDEGIDCDNDETVCRSDDHDWLATAKNKCCGDDGHDDFSMLAEDSRPIDVTSPQGHTICLNKEWITPQDWQTACTGDWCWVSAPENSFRIFTLREPLQKISGGGNDIVSNGEQWVSCSGNLGPLSAEGLFDINKADANRFYCYYGDKQYSFADCKQGEPPAELANLKERYKGDGLWKIPVNKVDEYLYSASFSIPQYELQAGKKGLDINFPGDTSANIEFFVRFIGEDKFTLPVGLNLVIKGPKPSPATGRVIYFSQNVLGYAQTSLEKNKWLHIKVPLTNELYGIEEITLEATPVDNQIEVKGLQVTWETPSGKVPICSGEKTAEGSAWRESFDFHKSRSYSAENMCNEFFSPEEEVAWLGNSIDLPGLPAERQCCGDDLAEYYAGPSKAVDGKHYGCWNSQPIKDGETTMNVEVEVKWEEEKREVEYRVKSFNYEAKLKLTKDLVAPVTQVIGGEYNYADSPNCVERFSPINNENLIPPISPASGCYFYTQSLASQKFQASAEVTPGTRLDAGTSRELIYSQLLYNKVQARCLIDKVKFYTLPDISYLCSKTIDIYYWYICNADEKGTTIVANGQTYFCNTDTGINTAVDTIGNEFDFHFWQPVSSNAAGVSGSVTSLTLGSSPQKVTELPITTEAINNHFIYSLSPQDSDEYKIYFYDPLTDHNYDKELVADSFSSERTIYIIAETSDVIASLLPEEQREFTFTFSCPQKEGEEVSACLYPLPGQPLYRITNPHPDLYELYFVGDVNEDGLLDSQELQGVPITQTDQQFNVPGTLKAKKVSQQVVLVNTLDPDSEEEGQEARFYGCQAADSIEDDNLPAGFTDYENLGYCQVKADKFCSPSLRHAGTAAEQKEFTTINSWSAEPAGVIGYRAITEAQQADVESFYANRQLQLKTGEELTSSLVFGTKKISELTAAMRNYSASVLPARNFLSNAEFHTSGLELPHWEIFSSGQLVDGERDKVTAGVITLSENEVLRSERIAIPQNVKLHFSQAQASSCPNMKIILVDTKTEASTEITPPQLTANTGFLTGTNSYALLEFTGTCSVERPMLQLRDDLGKAAYYSIPNVLATDARSGLACCPQDYCWNGYACVEPMGSFTYLAEHIAEGRDYRCLNGEWSYMPVRKDWNNDNWGFCEQNEQCFVLSSTEGASFQSKAADFYNSKASPEAPDVIPPTCIDDKEFIFDHYCQQGSWSSRTKFIATKLLEVAGDEYTLYCTSYRDALLNTSNQGEKDNFLGGLGEGTGSDQPSDPLASAQPQQLSTCFKLKGVENLVPAEENTCINNVCLLKDEDGKIALATSLNKNTTAPFDQNHFFLALNIPLEQVNEICQGEGEFMECDLSGLDLDGDLWYSKKLNAIVYGKQGISLGPGIIDKIIDWFQNLFGINAEEEPTEEQEFVQQAQNFRELYISTEGGRKVRALQEIFPDTKALVAEFEDFETPVCEYLKSPRLQLPTSPELLGEVTGQTPVSCSQTENLQRLEVLTSKEKLLEFLWPQLSGMLRAG